MYRKATLFVLVNISGIHFTCGQVNHEIFSEEDLLATDSSYEGVNQVVLPPPSFGSNSVEDPSDEIFFANRDIDGSHSFSYSLPDGTVHSQRGYFTENGYVMEGSWEFIGTDGLLYRTEFIADHLGYRPRIIPSPVRRFRRKSRKVKGFKKRLNRVFI